MGTSHPYNGPKGRTPLLPPGAPPPPEDPQDPIPPGPLPPPSPDEPPKKDTPPVYPDGVPSPGPFPPLPAPEIPWSTPKKAMGRFAKSGGGDADSFRPVASKFVKAQGGASQATRASVRGISTAQRLAGALVAVIEGGEAGLRQFLSADFVGRSADEVLAALIDELAPAGAQNEDAAARDAACTVLGELFVKYSVRTTGINGLASLTLPEVADVVVQYVASYIFSRLMQILAIRLERDDMSATAACRMERDVRDYVQERVKAEVTPPQITNIRFTAQQGQRVIERVFNDAYSIIEVWEE